jgi:hypothetical protein
MTTREFHIGGSDDDPYEPSPRFTQVHSRFQVLGYIGGEAELVETFQRRDDAIACASRLVGPKQYERTEVYDTMQRPWLARTIAHFPPRS